jgi:hypothetical protein
VNNFTSTNVREVLKQFGVSFETLETDEILGFYIGSIRVSQPVIDDLIQNTQSSSFSDILFRPLTVEEIKKLQYVCRFYLIRKK